ncbi:single-stranded DNA-binding protein [Crocosphaera watsonii]|uniref:Single-stranded DNA-binding protein n=3 Tax=Crocosphaera watsonii TaxID=263511 RepID=T2JMT9_CROWT|nr:single-stranded DNA-binding protein [Crocosphaera watsonii]EHJ09483.1 Single-stranded DNA-binding protein [Crocosphaera watsonii WH 0003]MCH2232200.1 single-stranded DNA-binding protein [Crocinitomicaceae bacterium]CCQ57303.1 Single-stranded DNA-binding protein [Crocosphaera watsonii WH 0005]CCQ66356.1 Single-stranded DNA-binding protein [Crocosphaera watsonii WH 0402]
MTTLNINQINLVGRLGKDPEIKWFDSGKVLAKINLAVKRPSNTDKTPNWFDLELWGKTAEIASEYTNKGSLIAIEGELKFDEWLDKDTNKQRSKPVVKVNRLELLASSNNMDSQSDTIDDEDDF